MRKERAAPTADRAGGLTDRAELATKISGGAGSEEGALGVATPRLGRHPWVAVPPLGHCRSFVSRLGGGNGGRRKKEDRGASGSAP